MKYLIDVNLPYKLKFYNISEFIHVNDINDEWSDGEIWEFAKKNNLIIVTKDTDFSDKMIIHTPPPKVVHLKVGNMKLKEFKQFLKINWPDIESLMINHKLLNVYLDRIVCIK